MKFGKLDHPPEALDWRLPASPVGYGWSDVQPEGSVGSEAMDSSAPGPVVRAGGTMWTIKPWRGSVYPEKDPQRTWHGHYGRQFGTLEFNATH